MYTVRLLAILQYLTNELISQADIAKILGMTKGAVSNRIPREIPFSDDEIEKIESHYNVKIRNFSCSQKTDRQLEIEKALAERKTFGQKLNYLQSVGNVTDTILSKETKLSERKIERLGEDKEEPTLEELKALKSFFEKQYNVRLSLDLLVYGEGETSCGSTPDLTPEELAVLKKFAQRNL